MLRKVRGSAYEFLIFISKTNLACLFLKDLRLHRRKGKKNLFKEEVSRKS